MAIELHFKDNISDEDNCHVDYKGNKANEGENIEVPIGEEIVIRWGIVNNGDEEATAAIKLLDSAGTLIDDTHAVVGGGYNVSGALSYVVDGDIVLKMEVWESEWDGNEYVDIVFHDEIGDYTIMAIEEESGSIHVTSDPTGATIYVDNEEKGETPISVSAMPGEHTVSAVMDGYVTGNKTVTVNSGETVDVHFNLKEEGEEPDWIENLLKWITADSLIKGIPNWSVVSTAVVVSVGIYRMVKK